MTGKTRNWHFELLRIISMLLIVATHYFASANFNIKSASDSSGTWKMAIRNSLQMSGQVGVTLFVLISAFFLSKSNSSPVRRMIRLWIQVFIYSGGSLATYIIITKLLNKQTIFLTSRNVLASVFPITMGTYWFMSAFFALLCVSPFINKLVSVLSKQDFLVLLCIFIWFVFIWRILNPLTLQYFTDIGYLSTIYLIGTFISKYSILIPKISLWQVILVCCISFSICAIGTNYIETVRRLFPEFGYPANLLTAGPGASPILSVITGCFIFLWVCKLPSPGLNTIWSKSILSLSPATLGVYLIHENFIIKNYLWRFVFQLPEPTSTIGIVANSAVSIVLIYIILLFVSYVIFKLLVSPLTTQFMKFAS